MTTAIVTGGSGDIGRACAEALIADGYRVGAGVEYALTGQSFVKLEYRYSNYSDAEIAELALGVGLFLGMSKVLITLGLEPEGMDTTVLPTPGS